MHEMHTCKCDIEVSVAILPAAMQFSPLLKNTDCAPYSENKDERFKLTCILYAIYGVGLTVTLKSQIHDQFYYKLVT